MTLTLSLSLLFDIVLIPALLLVSWRLLGASDLFQAIVLFISFGLFLALAWVRLQAPDVALAEAAVGAGIAGVLLFGTFKGIEPDSEQSEGPPALEPCRLDSTAACPGRVHYFLAGTLVAVLTLILVLAVLELPRTGPGLTVLVKESLDQSGVTHPVTAVLLNFRLYDTWLELGVLLLVLLGILGVRNRHDLTGIPSLPDPNPVLRWLVRGLTPMVLLTTIHLLWLGDHAPGGAFQAGVVLAAGLVLLWLSGHPSVTMFSRKTWMPSLIAGFAAILLMALLTTIDPGSVPLEYSPNLAKMLILVLECAAAFSIGVILASLAVLVLVGGSERTVRK